MRYLVTGGSGFIGSELIYQLLKIKNSQVVNVDNETYASNKKELENLYDDGEGWPEEGEDAKMEEVYPNSSISLMRLLIYLGR